MYEANATRLVTMGRVENRPRKRPDGLYYIRVKDVIILLSKNLLDRFEDVTGIKKSHLKDEMVSLLVEVKTDISGNNYLQAISMGQMVREG